MRQYHNLLEKILKEGVDKGDRTGVGTRSLFGEQIRFNLGHGYGFPLLATKYTNFRAILVELIWFLKGNTNVKWLNENGVHIWDEWADVEGNLGPVYGKQWRSWPQAHTPGEWELEPIDQIANVVKSLRENPFSRRHIVTAWNPAEVDNMALAPCHALFQFNVRPDAKGTPLFLDCQLYQRSADVFLGVPFNIASYALLTLMMCRVTGLLPGEFVHTFGDVHLYKNHFAQAAELLGRDAGHLKQPRIAFQGPIKEIEDFNVHNVILHDYEYLPAIKAPIAV